MTEPMRSEDMDAIANFRTIAENLTDMIALVDLQGRRLYCTPNYAFLGNPEKLLGSDSFAEIHPEDRERIRLVFTETVRTGAGQHAYYRFLLKDGSVRYIESQGIVVKDAAGRPEKVILVSRDITESKKLEDRERELEQKLLQADKLNSLGKTISGVAHELNNPLTGIMGFCQLLLRDEGIQENTRYREDLETIFREAERCQKIVKGLTTFARKHKPEKTFLGVNGLLQEVVRMNAYHLKNHAVSADLDLAPDLPKTMADYHQLQQVFVNLIINASDAISESGRPGRVRLSTSLAGGRIRVEVQDDGPGIPPEHLDRVFEPFFTTKAAGKGTGLGLPVVYGIVSEHGGTISAENVPGGGARFTVDLPVIAEPEPGAAPAAPQAVLWSGQRVLIVDDEQCVMDVLVRILRALRLTPDIARDGEMAKEKLRRFDYAAVLCDYRMPGMNGKELYEWAASERPQLGEKWVFLTGSVKGDTLDSCGRPVLFKPFTIDALQSALQAIIPGEAGR